MSSRMGLIAAGILFALAIIGVACAVLCVFDRLNSPDPVPRTRAVLMRRLRRFRLASAAPERCLDVRKAVLLKANDEICVPQYGSPQLLAIHCYLRNAHGEYFYVLVRPSDVPFGKHITHASARAMLKDKYVAPDSDPNACPRTAT